jgi:hypothetical protein
MYYCSSLLFGGTRAVVAQCRPAEARDAVSTIDLADRARWHRRCVRQGCLRCTNTRCCCLVGRAQMSDNVDRLRRAVQCRPSTSPPVHGSTAAVCAKVAYDVPVLAVIVWWDERRCRTMSTRRGALCSVDHRPRCPCTAAPPSCAPGLPTMYQYSLSSFGGTSADVGQCRLVEARCAVSTIDLAARARRRRRRVRQGYLRCTSTCCCRVVGRAQMSDNVDSSRPRCSVDHRPRRPCTVAPPSRAPRWPTMYQYSLSSFGGTSADVAQCRLVEARGSVSTIDLAARARWRRRRVRQGCLRCSSTCSCHSAGRAQMSDNVDSFWRAVQCRSSVSPPVCAGAMERLKCMFTHMVASIETIYSLPRGRFPSAADSSPAKRASDAARACAQNNRTSHFQAPLSMHWHVRLGTNATS